MSVTVVAPMPAARDATDTAVVTGEPPQVAHGAADVLREPIDREDSPRFVEPLPGCGHVAERLPCGGGRLLGGKAVLHERLGFELDVRANLAIEVVVCAGSLSG